MLLAFSVLSTESQAADTQVSVYKASADPMQDVQLALEQAKKNDKLALIILGAQWCHDSMGLADKFDAPEMQVILADNFETAFVDVGYLEDRRDITQRFGQANYFATPTVLIVDPHSERLLNADSLQKWGVADSIPVSQYIEYFSGFGHSDVDPLPPLSELNSRQIKQFELQQAERLMQAYRLLRTDLRADVERTPDQTPNEDFYKRWAEVRSFRLQLQADIQALYSKAREQHDAGLSLPTYPKFSWE
ncbi:hypothetical protein GCM10009114_34040 [Aliiglaciecola litoralis]|uniref:Thioredoxin family protein n=2 Tax=Aliiglaciecola litoralis TaxID=582857 RepID=A0ABP3X3G5_9ALTE